MSTLKNAVEHEFEVDGALSRISGLAHVAGELVMSEEDAKERAEEIERLKQLTERELDKLGIHSEGDMVRFAFRDLMEF